MNPLFSTSLCSLSSPLSLVLLSCRRWFLLAALLLGFPVWTANAQEATIPSKPSPSSKTKGPNPLPTSQTGAKLNLGLNVGGGVSTFANAQETLREGSLEANGFGTWDLMETCSQIQKASCLRFFFLGGAGGGYYASTQAGYLHIFPGVGIQAFFGEQRKFALNIKAGVGYKHTFLDSEFEQLSAGRDHFIRDESKKDLFILWIEPGVEFQLDALLGTKASQGFSLAASFRIENGPGTAILSPKPLPGIDVNFFAGVRRRF